MERRSFLALLAAAPIAALAPWAKAITMDGYFFAFGDAPRAIKLSKIYDANSWTDYPLVAALRLDLADPAHVDLDRLLRLNEYLGLN